MRNQTLSILFLLLTVTFFSTQPVIGFVPIEKPQRLTVQNFWRTELFFGRDKNDGSQVSDEEWSNFLDEIVTPFFPDGLSVFDVRGQYRLENGAIVKENSKMLILLYKPKTRFATNRKIERIRNEYKRRFKQESVMRIDFRQTVRVSF